MERILLKISSFKNTLDYYLQVDIHWQVVIDGYWLKIC